MAGIQNDLNRTAGASMGREQKIWLIGGSGDVGSRLARRLLNHTDALVTVLSRSGSNPTGLNSERLEARAVDIAADGAGELIPSDAIIVNLTEATPPAVAAQVVERGCTFIETSASPAYVAALGNEVCESESGGAMILCVGMAPGLTNLMAARVAQAEQVVAVDIGVEMGLGRHYGAAATEWFLKAAGTEYQLIRNGSRVPVRPGRLRRFFVFWKSEARRPALGLGFAEHEILASDPVPGLSTVRSFVSIDPPIITRILGLILSLGLGPWVARNARWLTRFLSRLPGMGQTRTRIVAEGLHHDGTMAGRLSVTTGDQAEATATMILATLLAVMAPGAKRTGVATIRDYLVLEDAITALSQILPETQMDTRDIKA